MLSAPEMFLDVSMFIFILDNSNSEAPRFLRVLATPSPDSFVVVNVPDATTAIIVSSSTFISFTCPELILLTNSLIATFVLAEEFLLLSIIGQATKRLTNIILIHQFLINLTNDFIFGLYAKI